MMKKTTFAPLAALLLSLLLVVSIFSFSGRSLAYASADPAAAASSGLDDATRLVAAVNVERMKTQMMLVERSLAAGDADGAFAHAFIPHATTFPAVKGQLYALDPKMAGELEASLTDLAFGMRDGKLGAGEAKALAGKISGLLDDASSELPLDRGMASQTAAFLLRDAVQSYRLSNAGAQKVDYENALGLVQAAQTKYETIAGGMEERRQAEINSFFADLKAAAGQKSGNDSVARLATAIERDLAEDLSAGSASGGEWGGYAQYFTTIRGLLGQVVSDVQAGDYKQADSHAVSAYLDNFEYLEAPLEKHDAQLVGQLELEMREQLRNMIRAGDTPADISAFVKGINVKLDTAEGLLKNDPGYAGAASSSSSAQSSFADIKGLSEGFGSYQGERRERGDAGDQAKAEVRANIDQIRVKLDETLRRYQAGDREGALLVSRSAYLDSYENIELPLRPINPDFTLEMEIGFAELRNLIQAGAPYDGLVGKVAEIRKGLDESERLVSGTGVLAPTIAFSTSFSIIFREGLESALIIGAILTYLEASRNERFKKHVYYGIALAFAGTAATWFLAQYIIEISGASRDLIEAIAGVSAVAVLFWVSFWILNKVETKKWIEFVKAKVWKATTTGSVMVFVMLSFFTVYREGFETVLFYQAMLSFARYMEWYVAAGLLSGLGVIAGVTFLVRKLGKKLPLRVLFGLTMGIGAYMSIAFIGNAVREFQDVGYLPTTHMIGTIPRLDINLAAMTGIHPTLETVLAQVALLAVYLVGSAYVLVLQPRRKKMIESARKSRADLDSASSTTTTPTTPAAAALKKEEKADVDIEDH